MKLNLGCGEQYAEGWLNVDQAGSPHKRDQTVDLRRELPWLPSSIERIYAGHVLEHLDYGAALKLLIRLRNLSTPGAVILIVGPDVELAAALQERGYPLEVPLEHLRSGAGRWEGDEHLWECTQRALVQLLTDAGWSDVEGFPIDQVPPDWPVAFRGPQWQVAATGVAK